MNWISFQTKFSFNFVLDLELKFFQIIFLSGSIPIKKKLTSQSQCVF